MDMIIQNVTVVNADKQEVCDVRIEEGVICEIGKSLSVKDNSCIDANSLFMLPGVIDLASQFNNSVEDITKFKERTIRGGITTTISKPYTSPMIDNPSVLTFFKLKERQTKGADIAFSVSASLKDSPHSLSEQATLFQEGAVAVHLSSDANSNTLRRTFEYAQMAKKPLLMTCSNKTLEASGVMIEGEMSAMMGVPGIDPLSESSEIAKVAEFSKRYNVTTIINDLFSKEGVARFEREQKEDIPLFATASLQHLLFNDQACQDFNVAAKVYPPLGSKADQEALLSALESGLLSALTSSDNLQSYMSKDQPFAEASYGVAIAEYLLPLAYHYFVVPKRITFEKMVSLLSKAPAQLMGFDMLGEIAVGKRANFVLFDPEGQTEMEDNGLYSSVILKGKVISSWINGVSE
jgi:dihydroorotase